MFCWILGHCWLPGSEAANAAVKVAGLHRVRISDRVYSSDVCTHLHFVILFLWQYEWVNAQGNKLHVVKPCVPEWLFSFSVSRRRKSYSHAFGLVTCT
jgi:hypothetical protein